MQGRHANLWKNAGRRLQAFLLPLAGAALLTAAAAATADAAPVESRHTQLARKLAEQAAAQEAEKNRAATQPDENAPAGKEGAAGEAGAPLDVILQNGAEIRADLLHRDRSRLILDLGYEVLTVPVSEVVEERTPRYGGATGETASTTASIPGAGLPTPSPDGALPVTGPFDASIERLQEAVVMVSNARGLGAGFILSPDGLVMTNFHVVRGERLNDVTVFLRKSRGSVEQKKYRDAEVKAYSSLLDVALVQIPASQLEGLRLPFVEFAAPETIRTGMRVHAIGNPAVGAKVLDHTISDGIVSSTSRNFNDILYIQTTAAVNPGNSGGPLLNDLGQVVGMVTFRAIFQEGLAFALPASYLRHFRDHLSAFAPTGDDKKLGYRYHDPSR